VLLSVGRKWSGSENGVLSKVFHNLYSAPHVRVIRLRKMHRLCWSENGEERNHPGDMNSIGGKK